MHTTDDYFNYELFLCSRGFNLKGHVFRGYSGRDFTLYTAIKQIANCPPTPPLRQH